MELGAFSISLSVQDLDKSSEFYQKLGFEVTHSCEQYQILVNGTTVIGLFHGMFEGNILTFNPGLSAKSNSEGALMESWRVEEFTDIRVIQKHLKNRGMKLISGVDKENRQGPASLMLRDPDGNIILVDQFFPHPDASPE
ncbi:MAG: VOC family protein [Bacteroidetes bacterium]|nr:VOC family protein [Bacteroidota bacterium]MCY4205052.1 VOC family protein [Bacteroidota bacterium]